ncbi:MAG: T9SS type A sorting domain-containing protein [Bacteroidales bacterium]|nr:T9SS type A sorting domain-containing protein [Bacteroidales bacterium]
MNRSIIFIVQITVLSQISFSAPDDFPVQDDTIYIPNISSVPVFDGITNDECWTFADWQTIDQVWIPYGESVSPADYSGKYKVVWSSEENLLYFAVEINDDVKSDAYIPGETAEIYNFDMFEVFIDEDKSGGYHVFDGTANNETSLGVNAENAFAYHIFTEFPGSGQTNTVFRVEDLGGTGWANAEHPIYNDHFPEFILRTEGTISTWEFSLIVYDDTYSDDNIEGSRITLTPNKIMGLSLAYNDDDEPEVDPVLTERDNFFGSVAVSEAAYNDHWKNADDFGPVKLTGSPLLTDQAERNVSNLKIIPNPSENFFQIIFNSRYTGMLKIKIFNEEGKEMYNMNEFKITQVFDHDFSYHFLPGMYFLMVNAGDESVTQKVLVSR